MAVQPLEEVVADGEVPQDTANVAQKIMQGRTPTPTEVINYFKGELTKRVCLLDGGIGTSIDAAMLEEQDYRGQRFKDCPSPLKGNKEVLNLTQPEMIA